jgi:hypothetical protein
MANVSRMMVDLDKLLALVDRRIDQAMREGKPDQEAPEDVVRAVEGPSWPFRMGTNPFRRKRSLSAEQKTELVERLGQARDRRSVQNN